MPKPILVLLQGEMMPIKHAADKLGVAQITVKRRHLRGEPVDMPLYHSGRGRRGGVKHGPADFDIDAEWADECVAESVRLHPDGMTLHEVGVLVGLSRERIRQIEESALRKIRLLGLSEREVKRALFADLQVAHESFDERHPPGHWGVVAIAPHCRLQRPSARPSGLLVTT
jgi:predicted transcriptional regulator